MNDRTERAVTAAIAELRRQHDAEEFDTPCIYQDENPRDVGIDGRVDLVKVVEAALAAADHP